MGVRGRRSRRIRQLMDKYEARCAYCSAPVLRRPILAERWRQATIDHDIPLSAGGTWAWENLVLACYRCNQRKGNLTGAEFRTLRAARVEAGWNWPQEPRRSPPDAIVVSG